MYIQEYIYRITKKKRPLGIDYIVHNVKLKLRFYTRILWIVSISELSDPKITSLGRKNFLFLSRLF